MNIDSEIKRACGGWTVAQAAVETEKEKQYRKILFAVKEWIDDMPYHAVRRAIASGISPDTFATQLSRFSCEPKIEKNVLTLYRCYAPHYTIVNDREEFSLSFSDGDSTTTIATGSMDLMLSMLPEDAKETSLRGGIYFASPGWQ